MCQKLKLIKFLYFRATIKHVINELSINFLILPLFYLAIELDLNRSSVWNHYQLSKLLKLGSSLPCFFWVFATFRQIASRGSSSVSHSFYSQNSKFICYIQKHIEIRSQDRT